MNHPHIKLPWPTHPVDCALYGAVREIAALANIPENRCSKFYSSFSDTLYFYLQLEHDELRHESPELKDAAFMEAEEAARAALKAISRLTEEQEKLLFRATYKKWKDWWIDCLTGEEDYFEEPDPDNNLLCGYLEKIVRAFSRLTGNPVPDSYSPLGPSGPHKKNWLITQLVGALFIEPWRHGGSLSLHDKDESKGQIPAA